MSPLEKFVEVVHKIGRSSRTEVSFITENVILNIVRTTNNRIGNYLMIQSEKSHNKVETEIINRVGLR